MWKHIILFFVFSKALIIPSRDGRFKFKIFKTVEAGLKLFSKYNIQLPKPVIFMWAPLDKNTITISISRSKTKEITPYELPECVKNKYPFF